MDMESIAMVSVGLFLNISIREMEIKMFILIKEGVIRIRLLNMFLIK